MTTYAKAAAIIAETLPKCRGEKMADAADRILRALLAKRIMPTTMRASADMFKRFHAHVRFLGKETGYGYRYFYNLAVSHAESVDEWPVKIITRTVEIDGVDITVDVSVPESTTRATNGQLLMAYSIIEEGAREHGITLPENEETI